MACSELEVFKGYNFIAILSISTTTKKILNIAVTSEVSFILKEITSSVSYNLLFPRKHCSALLLCTKLYFLQYLYLLQLCEWTHTTCIIFLCFLCIIALRLTFLICISSSFLFISGWYLITSTFHNLFIYIFGDISSVFSFVSLQMKLLWTFVYWPV